MAEQGNINAMTRLALMYDNAQGTVYSFEECVRWDKQAAELGDVTALFNLGVTYRRVGDVRTARQWFEKALAAGDAEAGLELAKMYLISELEKARVREYLLLALQDDTLLETSREEALRILNEEL